MKIFLWEVSHSCITLVKSSREGSLGYTSLHLVVQCAIEMSSHISIYSAIAFSLPRSGTIYNRLLKGPSLDWVIFSPKSLLLMGHPFQNDKKILWLRHVRAFFWNL